MRCSKCGRDNREGRKFCADCGAPLAAKCQQCGASNEPGEGFCGEYGTALAAAVSDASDAPVGTAISPPPIPAPEITGERRHLTVLFCDLVGSTAIAAQLDPEEWRETVAGYHRAAAEAITRRGYRLQALALMLKSRGRYFAGGRGHAGVGNLAQPGADPHIGGVAIDFET